MNPLATKPGMLDLSWRMFGTPVRVKIWFWIFMAFFGYLMLGQQWDTRGGQFFLINLAIWVACGFIAVLVHEMGHITAGRIFGYPGVIILSSFGGGAVGEYMRAHRWQRIVIAASGPLAAFLFYGIIYLLTPTLASRILAIRDVDLADHLNWALLFLVFQLVFWNILNLPPILPLDGGMIFKDAIGYVLGKYDFVVATIVSVVIAFGIVAYSLYKWRNPAAPYLDGVFQPLFPAILRNNALARLDPDPLFNAIMYGLLGFQNVMALFKKKT